jgi:cytochrome c
MWPLAFVLLWAGLIFVRRTIGGLIVAAIVVVLIALGLSHQSPASAVEALNADDFSPYVTKDGSISLPADYREKFLHLGTWAVATKPGKPVDELHNVYTRPEDIEAYRKDGRFPDGAVLVKEITNVGSYRMTTGQSTWSEDIKIWFVMVKNSKGRFPKNLLWAEGWGWALFDAKDAKRNVATGFDTDCKICHVPAKKDDWVYVRGYQVLAKTSLRK